MAAWDSLRTISNASIRQSPSFYLTGIPGYENLHHFISIPFCAFYLIGIVGNCTILHIIHTDKGLHEPMYYFLAMLSFTDIGMSISTLPTVLKILWFEAREIEVNACVAQMYFIHTFSLMESAVLLAMAFDRYIAICDPLRYSSKLTPQRIIYIGIFIVIRCSIVLPVVLARIPTFSFCHSHVLSHSFCLHQDVIRLACTDISFNISYGLFVVAFYWGIDSLGIFLSYAFILHSVLGIASQGGKLKALNTCASHICAVLILYVPMIGLSLVHRFAKHSSPIIHITMANIYLLVPPVLNPIIYSIKTKQIRQGFLRILSAKRVGFAHT
ncbi:olfactory receptor 51G1 [Equus caballus]|uniref:Olfactory receptor n=1 Tax=Equus caballus TaxID=9796 RepID=F7BS24_HORSE|nr:olfactory receptor 51G1-like [Equus caballus]XP_008523058.1 PREDICTED: olfactory receptor 51G1-like [Equus przewalskii]